MVKEYSRSSADQQEPLPHELRPISVLMFTMDYLISNIMDISLDNITLADWYDFIWNRTRSIRKVCLLYPVFIDLHNMQYLNIFTAILEM